MAGLQLGSWLAKHLPTQARDSTDDSDNRIDWGSGSGGSHTKTMAELREHKLMDFDIELKVR